MSAINITGQVFGRLTAVRGTDRRWARSVVWECQCVCGKTKLASANKLRAGSVKSCGCLLKENAALVGRAYGKLNFAKLKHQSGATLKHLKAGGTNRAKALLARLAICALGLLLSCGVVEAQQDLYTDCIHTAPDGTVYDICRMPDMRKILSESKSCEVKMKEAMKLAQKHQDNLFTQLNWKTTAYSGAYSGMRCVTVECLQKELDEAKAAEKAASELKQAKIRWDAIYQECAQ